MDVGLGVSPGEDSWVWLGILRKSKCAFRNRAYVTVLVHRLSDK